MNVLKKNCPFLVIVISLTLLLQYTPFLHHLRQTPADRVYLGAERYTPDYYVYLFYLNQGALGRWTVSDYYTNYPHAKSLVHEEYLILGKIGSRLGLSLPATYYLSQSLFLILYLLVSFWFISLFFKEKIFQYLTFIFSIFYSGVFWPVVENGKLLLKSYFDFYQPPDLINRLTFEPHKFMGMSLFPVVLVLFYNFYNRYNRYNGYKRLPLLIALFFLSLLAGLVHGITSISLVFTFIFFLFFQSIILILNKKTLHSLRLSVFPIFLVFSVSLILLALPLYFKIIFQTNPVWYGVFTFWEGSFVDIDKKAALLPTIAGYLIVLGPLMVLAAIGLQKFLKETKQLGLLLFSFLSSNLFLFFFGYIFLLTSKHRYFQTPYLVGWSVMAMYGLKVLGERIRIAVSRGWREPDSAEFFALFCKKLLASRSRQDPRESLQSPAGRNSNLFLLLTFYFLLLTLGLPNLQQGLNRQLFQFGTAPNLEFLAYPPKEWFSAIEWLKNTPYESVILSLPTAGEMIPAFPGRKVVVGDMVHSYRYFEKLPQVQKFFRAEMNETEAKEYLYSENVNFVFYGQEEKALGNLNYTFLTPVFQNTMAVIYKFSGK